MEIEAATHKRDLSFGFTFDQKRMKKDRRRHIPLFGEKVSAYYVLLVYHYQYRGFIKWIVFCLLL
jgi:hypothetical protein